MLSDSVYIHIYSHICEYTYIYVYTQLYICTSVEVIESTSLHLHHHFEVLLLWWFIGVPANDIRWVGLGPGATPRGGKSIEN